MIWEKPLKHGILIQRYKRFLSDVVLDGETILAHVPNTGAMTSCWAPEWKCAISESSNPNRKIPYTLELTWNGESWIGVNTANANKVAGEWLREGAIPELYGYKTVISEKKIGDSRVDFYLEDHPFLPPCYVEVKNVTLKKDGHAQFPDAKTDRGAKHLRELMSLKEKGFRAVMLFVVQREDVDFFSPASSIDPIYSKLLDESHTAGVEILVYQCKISPEGIELKRPLNFKL